MKSAVLLTIFFTNVLSYGQTTVTFTVESLTPGENEKVGIRGNIPPLDWYKSIALNKVGEKYTVDIDFPTSEQELEFKFVLFTDDKNPTWESIQNRTFTLLAKDQQQISNNKWNQEQIVDISTLEEIAPDGLLEDFELIKTMVLEVHPGTYRYNTEEEIIAALDELKNKFSSPLTHQEAYLAISKLTAQIKCDHTKAGFNNQKKTINSIIHYQCDKVPFTFRWVDDEMVVLNNASESELLERGTKILSINQVPVTEIRDRMLDYIGADGATDNNRIYKTQVNGYDFRYNAFDIFYPLLYPLTSQEIALEIQRPDKNTLESIVMSTMTREERSKVLTERYSEFPASRDDMWNFEVHSDSIAVLTLNSFGLMGWKAMTIDYKAFLADAFQQIDELRIQHLIIDIRENNGGNDEMADELFSYLAEDSYNFNREGRTRYVKFPETLKSYIQTWGDNPWYFKLKPKGKKTDDGYYIFKENLTQSARNSDKKIYQGKSYLLTSSANTSLAFYTAYRFKYQQLGTIVGQETGGNLNDINGGQILFLRLPNSGIEIDFPVMGGFSTQKQPNSGVRPDIEVEYTVQDITEERDLEMEEVLKILDK